MKFSIVRLCFLLAFTFAFSEGHAAQAQKPSQTPATFSKTAAGANPFSDTPSNHFGAAIPDKKVRRVRAESTPLTDDQIRDNLKQKSNLIYDQEPFSIVIESLREPLKTNIVFDSSLEGRLDGDTLVSSNLTGMHTGSALRTLLKTVDATWVVKGGALRIVPLEKEHDSEFLVRRLIDVEDLLDEAQERARQDGGMMGMGGMAAPSIASQASAAELQNVIHQTISPQNWMDSASCRTVIFNGTLIVLASEKINEEVELLITELRQRSQK